MTRIDDLLQRAQSLLDNRQLWWALELLEERRFAAADDARTMKAIDRFIGGAIDPDEVRRYYDHVSEDLEKVVSWLAYLRLRWDLWAVVTGTLRSACVLEALSARIPGLGLAPLPLAEAIEELSLATSGFTDSAAASHIAKAGPLLAARIEAYRSNESLR